METLLFVLTPEDQHKIIELTLAGVIASKLAKGEYDVDTELGQLKVNYESCSEVNAGLHKKFNAIRKILYPSIQPVTPEWEDDED